MSFELIGGHNVTPQHLPIGSLKVFGCNPYGEAMWRVVWSESRYYLVGAKHVKYDGEVSKDAVVMQRGKDPNAVSSQDGYKWLPLYPGKPGWILELWKSPEAFTGCSPEQYEIAYRDPVTNLLTLGPYPTRGEYCQCLQFPQVPGFEQVALQVGKIRAGWSYSYSDKVAANKSQLEYSEKEKLRVFSDIFKDSQQAFNNRPSNIRPGKRTKEKINVSRSAESLNLDTRGGFSSGSVAAPRRKSHARNR